MSASADAYYERQNRRNLREEICEAESRASYLEEVRKSGRTYGAVDYGSGKIYIQRGFNRKIFYRKRR